MASLVAIQWWRDETDVLVAGYVIAGSAAAIEAHDVDPSADVLVVERAPEALAGGNGPSSGRALRATATLNAPGSAQEPA